MWHPFKNKAVRVDSTQVISVLKDQNTTATVGSGADYRPSYFWLPADYEKLVWTVVAGSVVVIGVYMGADAARQIAVNWTTPV